MERRQYRNPPLEEALCEFQFAPGAEWDFAFHIQFLERFRPEYAGKVRRQQMMEAGIQVGPQQTEPAMTMKQGQSRLQYLSADETRIVGIGPDVLSIHVLRPYDKWEDFEARVKRAFGVYREVARPAGVKRLALRYLNRIQLPLDRVRLEDYFTSPPRLPETVPAAIQTILTRFESVYNDAPVRLTVTFASLEAPAGSSAYLLDTEVSQEWKESPLPLDEALTVVQNLKQRQTDAFESMITEKTREVFNAAGS
jgi:uncharacterized protein (TIGR04255 family)